MSNYWRLTGANQTLAYLKQHELGGVGGEWNIYDDMTTNLATTLHHFDDNNRNSFYPLYPRTLFAGKMTRTAFTGSTIFLKGRY